MNYCYYNTDHKKEIEQGKGTTCTNTVEGNTYCELHKEEIYGPESIYRKKSLESIQKRLKEMGKNAKTFKTGPIKKMRVADLCEFRLEIKAWLATHRDHNKYQKGKEKVKEIEQELLSRGVVNPDGKIVSR